MPLYPRIPSEQVLLRTLIEKSWVQKGKPHYSAFQLRNQNENGVSLLYGKGDAVSRFQRPIFGFLDVLVGKVEKVELDDHKLIVVQNECRHAEIAGLPNKFRVKNLELQKRAKSTAIAMGKRIAETAASVNKYSENPLMPSDLLDE